MSVVGHSRPMHSVPVPINVRCYSNSDILVRRSEVTLRAKSLPMRLVPASNISAYVFCHHENNGDLHQALHSRKPDVDSIKVDNPFTVRLRPAKFPPNT
jgi:hypothetical protein